MKRRCSQWLPKQEEDVGWFSSSTPSSKAQPKRSRPTAATRGVTILATPTPRSVLTLMVLSEGTWYEPAVPSGQV